MKSIIFVFMRKFVMGILLATMMLATMMLATSVSYASDAPKIEKASEVNDVGVEIQHNYCLTQCEKANVISFYENTISVAEAPTNMILIKICNIMYNRNNKPLILSSISYSNKRCAINRCYKILKSNEYSQYYKKE